MQEICEQGLDEQELLYQSEQLGTKDRVIQQLEEDLKTAQANADAELDKKQQMFQQQLEEVVRENEELRSNIIQWSDAYNQRQQDLIAITEQFEQASKDLENVDKVREAAARDRLLWQKEK